MPFGMDIDIPKIIPPPGIKTFPKIPFPVIPTPSPTKPVTQYVPYPVYQPVVQPTPTPAQPTIVTVPAQQVDWKPLIIGLAGLGLIALIFLSSNNKKKRR